MSAEEKSPGRFLEEQLREHPREIEEILRLQNLLESLPPANEGVYITVDAVANSE